MLAIDLTPLKPGSHELALEPAAEDLDLPAEEFTDIRVTVNLDFQPRRIVARLRLAAAATLECDRTLELFQERVDGEHTVIFLPAEEVPQDPAGYDENVRPLPEPGEPLDLTKAARDTLVLALPARRVAPGAEKRDLRLRFGEAEGEAADPRWEALRRLREKS